MICLIQATENYGSKTALRDGFTGVGLFMVHIVITEQMCLHVFSRASLAMFLAQFNTERLRCYQASSNLHFTSKSAVYTVFNCAHGNNSPCSAPRLPMPVENKSGNILGVQRCVDSLIVLLSEDAQMLLCHSTTQGLLCASVNP